jgi:hypothetical protein
MLEGNALCLRHKLFLIFSCTAFSCTCHLCCYSATLCLLQLLNLGGFDPLCADDADLLLHKRRCK